MNMNTYIDIPGSVSKELKQNSRKGFINMWLQQGCSKAV